MTFDEIEDCFPDGACCDDATGAVVVSAQWLHDFAHNVAAKEREACAKIAEGATAYTQLQTVEHYKIATFIAAVIRERSIVE